MTTLLVPAADTLLADLNGAQREAVQAAEGPLAILAAAGTGKTRVISRRTAWAVATGVVPADQVLVVTFTDKAATEMVERLAALGLPQVTARTFHAHALSQLRHFWPSRHDGARLPDLLDSKLPLLIPIARALPGHYRFTAVKDLADEIEWAKSRRIGPADYLAAAEDREPPVPADVMARAFADYERSRVRAGRIDFEDLLTLTAELLEADAEAAEVVRARKRWFSVDEYQDTNPVQERLLELWVGDGRDVCVVGDEDQTIYTFTGATSAFLTGFADRWPGARTVTLSENYRSSRQVLELANRLLAGQGSEKRLVATQPDGPRPVIERHPDDATELAALVARVRAWLAAGVAADEIAVLVRTNAQLAPIEEALTRADIPFRVRGIRFHDRPEVRAAIDVTRRAKLQATGVELAGAVRDLWRRELGHGDESAEPTAGGAATHERAAALDTLLGILDDLVAGTPDVSAEAFAADLARRRASEREGSSGGVNLSTLHRAKGLEWEAVLLPALEEGSLPIRPSDDDEAIAEERRLLYVGITRARVHLALTWAERRNVRGKAVRRRRSRFLEGLLPAPRRTVRELGDAFEAPVPRADPSLDPLFVALRDWRADRAKVDEVPAYVVAHDQTLQAIVDTRPTTLPGLRRVHGMGPAKLERYGAEILAIVAASRQS